MFRRPGTFFDILHARSGQTPGAYADAALAARSPCRRRRRILLSARRAPQHTSSLRLTALQRWAAARQRQQAAACAVKKGVYLRQAKSADVVCM